jgi:sugar phosphate isomerase/epimerase
VRFGLSTHLYHEQRLDRAHLAEIAAHGFDAIELFAARGHFDYHEPSAIADLERWLAETGLRLHSIHAPIVERITDGRWGAPLSNATTDHAARERAVGETTIALEVARHIPAGFLVVHLGTPDDLGLQAGNNDPDAARQSLEEIYRSASVLGVRVAIEVIPNDLSDAERLVQLLENDVELPEAGVCLDFGHAFMMGDLLDAIETVAGHLLTTHMHDNQGQTDTHLAPFEGAIDWPAAMMELQKIGYDGTLIFELASSGTPAEALEKARQSRERLSDLLTSDLRLDR